MYKAQCDQKHINKMSRRYLSTTSSSMSARNIPLVKNGSRKVSSWELQASEFSSRMDGQQRASNALQGRLEEILVFELNDAG
jgi:hypothetical protein